MKKKTSLKAGVLTLLLFLAPTCFSGTNDDATLHELSSMVAADRAELHLLQQRVTELFQLRDKEIATAAEAVDKRLAGMNEFRAQLEKQAGTFLSKEAYDIDRRNLELQVQEVKLAQANFDGKMFMVGAGLTIFFTIFNGVALILIKKTHHSTK